MLVVCFGEAVINYLGSFELHYKDGLLRLPHQDFRLDAAVGGGYLHCGEDMDGSEELHLRRRHSEGSDRRSLGKI